jgi:hypothetical protein
MIGLIAQVVVNPTTIRNKTDHHNITEILLKVALNTINQPINHFIETY